MSVGLLLSSPDDAVIWRGPKKNGFYTKVIVNLSSYMANLHKIPFRFN